MYICTPNTRRTSVASVVTFKRPEPNQPFHSKVLMPGNRSPQDHALINGLCTSLLGKSKDEMKDNLLTMNLESRGKNQIYIFPRTLA